MRQSNKVDRANRSSKGIPTDIESLQSMVRSLQKELEDRDTKIQNLEELYQRARQELFGSKSGQRSPALPEQLVSNEGESGSAGPIWENYKGDSNGKENSGEETTTVAGHARHNPSRIHQIQCL